MAAPTRFPAILNRVTGLFRQRRESGRTRPASATSPESRRDRHAIFEEMLLSNPAAFATEFGMQWMYTTYTRR